MSALLRDRDDVVWSPDSLNEYLEELAATSDSDVDWRRYEIVDGMLVVSPQPGWPHIRVVSVLNALMVPATPAGCLVTQSVAVSVDASYRVPDLAIVRDRAPAARPELDDFLLVVEIESPSSITTDRITKPAQYAAVGIPFYWRIQLDPLRLFAYRLHGGVYAESGSWAADETARIAEPLQVEIEIRTLTGPR